jgi:hypothetical protein
VGLNKKGWSCGLYLKSGTNVKEIDEDRNAKVVIGAKLDFQTYVGGNKCLHKETWSQVPGGNAPYVDSQRVESCSECEEAVSL